MATAPAPYSVITPAAPVYARVPMGAADRSLMEGDSTMNDTPVTGLYAVWATTFKAGVPSTLINGGVNGDRVAGVKARILSDLIAAAATCMWLGIGSNDVFSGTAPGAFRADLNSCLSLAINTYGLSPSKIALLTVPWRGSEQWTTGPAWVSAFEAAIVAINAEILGAAAAFGCVQVDWRERLLWREVDLNRSKASTNVLTLDGTHTITLGQDQCGNIMLNDHTTIV
jgi:lysophospholipase L1-like esterase